MVIDASALLAIFLAEPERPVFLDLILQAGKRLISAANVLETGIVLETRRGESAGREFDLFVVRTNLEIVRSTPSRSRSLVPLGAVLEKAAIRRRSISETVLRMLLLGLRESQS